MRMIFMALIGLLLFQTACTEKGIKTEHGFRLIKHTDNKGEKPQYGDKVLVNVTTYVGDSIMGSTWRTGGPREIDLPPADKIPAKGVPVFDALLLMSKGDSCTVFQTLDTNMMKALPPALKDQKTVRFEVVLVDFTSKEEAAKRAATAEADGMKVAEIVKTTLAEYKSNTLGARLQKTPSNLEYVLLEMGGGAQINKGDRIPTNYYGVLKTTGEMFDNSYSRGGATPFTVGQMIPGFDEGLMLLKRGSKCIFFIPSVLGYGENAAGSIPPNSDLVFYVHVEE